MMMLKAIGKVAAAISALKVGSTQAVWNAIKTTLGMATVRFDARMVKESSKIRMML
jgi:hypothetical protein